MNESTALGWHPYKVRMTVITESEHLAKFRIGNGRDSLERRAEILSEGVADGVKRAVNAERGRFSARARPLRRPGCSHGRRRRRPWCRRETRSGGARVSCRAQRG